MRRWTMIVAISGLLAGAGLNGLLAGDAEEVTAVAQPPVGTPLYPGNRAPLVPSRFVKLPIGAIRPQGWLKAMLAAEAEGMTGHLDQISGWCKFEGNSWADPQGRGHSGWEELPYWLKGFGDLAYVTGDDRLLRETRRWIDAMLSSQDADGWFGPRGLKTSLEGKADLWPHMLALNILQSFYEHSGDARVLPFLTNYFRWQMAYPERDFVAGYWPKMRAGDNIESVLWLYNRTGEAWLLDLAKKLHRCAAPWVKGVANLHGVNFCQGFREPAMFWLASGDAADLKASERDYDTCLGVYGQVPGGMFGADENARPGYVDPRQGAETCSMVEFMHSFELLTLFTADPKWADRCEEVAFNSLPAALTPDLKALHYLTAPNQVQLDHANKSPGVQNGGCMFAYSAGEVYRCCQHNVAMGWPYFAENLWLGTADKGLAASLYAASEVTAKVGDGSEVTLAESGDYPFDETLTIKVAAADKPVAFPLYLRVPRWSGAPKVNINGQERAVTAPPSQWLRIDRTWRAGDTVVLQLPMSIKVRTWERNKNAVSVDRGPLTYSLKIGEDWQSKPSNHADFPDWDVLPTTPWNYGLVLDDQNPAASFQVVKKDAPLANSPFRQDTVPLALTVKARKIPGWQADHNHLITTLQPSPVATDQPEETVTLIPMGAARLRLSAFPVIGTGPDAHEWSAPAKAMVSASHCFENDSVDAMVSGMEPANSNDQNIPRYTWWPERGAKEWVQREFAKPRTVSATSVYWFDDRPGGGCRVPASWKILYRAGDQWKPVEEASAAGVETDRYNRVTFKAVDTTGLRIEIESQPDFAGGILQWKVEP